jgi:starch-binding outer membrane protein SusE/F
MRDLSLKLTKNVAIIAALFGLISLNSCKDDDEDPTPTNNAIVEDGFYIQGDATAYAVFDIKATLSPTKNEVLQEERSSLMEIYVAVKGTGGFNIVQVNGSERTTWGPSSEFALTPSRNEEPNEDGMDIIQRGAIEATDAKFTVAEDGLYHVIIDTELGVGAILPAKWGVIGQATPTGWSGSTALDAPTFDFNTMTFKKENVEMSNGEWKFRYSNGWKVQLDTTLDLGDGKKGVYANCNYGGSVDALEEGGSNFMNEKGGIFTVELTWTAGAGHTAMLTRTGDIPARDYSAVSVGLIGDGVVDGDWNGEKYASTPAKDGDVYTWNFNGVELNNTGGFKIRTAGTWDDINEGYSDIVGGPDAGEIQESGGNMQAVNGGTFDIEFVIDAAAETKSISITKK